MWKEGPTKPLNISKEVGGKVVFLELFRIMSRYFTLFEQRTCLVSH